MAGRERLIGIVGGRSGDGKIELVLKFIFSLSNRCYFVDSMKRNDDIVK